MDFQRFCNFVREYYDLKSLPDKNLYPKNIRLNSTIWKQIISLRSFTDQFGYEHSVSVFDAAESIIVTPPIRGTRTNVTTNYRIDVRYKQHRRDWFEKMIFVNGKLHLKEQLKYKDIKKEAKIRLLFSIHSHPEAKCGNQTQFSFFSQTDINSLFASVSICQGLVTDKFYLACKHEGSPSRLNEEGARDLNKLSLEPSCWDSPEYGLLENLGIILYIADFKKGLNRVS